MSLEQIERDPVRKTKITLKAIYGKQQGPLILSPAREELSGRLAGVELLSDEQAKKSVKIINEQTTRKITDGCVFDLNNDIDKLDWKWIKECGEIASDFDEAQSNPRALFYVEDLEAQTDKKLASRAQKHKAMSYVFESSTIKRQEVCRLLGKDVSYFSQRDIEDYLTELAETKPINIIRVFEDKDYKAKLFLYKLIDKKVIKISNGGVYKYNELTIGLNQEAVLYWLSDARNADIVREFHLILNPQKSQEPTSPGGDQAKKDSEKANQKASKLAQGKNAENEDQNPKEDPEVTEQF